MPLRPPSFVGRIWCAGCRPLTLVLRLAAQTTGHLLFKLFQLYVVLSGRDEDSALWLHLSPFQKFNINFPSYLLCSLLCLNSSTLKGKFQDCKRDAWQLAVLLLYPHVLVLTPVCTLWLTWSQSKICSKAITILDNRTIRGNPGGKFYCGASLGV